MPSALPVQCADWPRARATCPLPRQRPSISIRCHGPTWVATTNYSRKEIPKMADAKNLLLRSNLKQLRLPVMGAEFEKLAREAAAANESYEQFLLRLTELEVAARSSNAVQARIRLAGFPVSKDFDTFDFAAVPSLSNPKVLELGRGEWIEHRTNTVLCRIARTCKTHPADA